MEILVLTPSGSNILVWTLFFLYTISMFIIYWFGLPSHFKKLNLPHHVYYVGHGILKDKISRVKVYYAIYTEANAITLLGMLGLLVTLVLIISESYTSLIPFLFFASVIISDWLDGEACLRHDCHSKIGAIIDPIRDRFAILVLIFGLFKNNELTLVVGLMVLTVLILEFLIAWPTIKSWFNTEKVKVYRTGKIRQGVHLAAILTIFFSIYFNVDLTGLIIFALSAMSLASLFHYHKMLIDSG